MFNRFSHLLLLILMLPLMLEGCAPASPPQPTPTRVTPAPEPTATRAPEANSLGLTTQDIALDAQGVGEPWQAVLVPALPFDIMRAPGPSGLPQHIQILFDGLTDPFQRSQGQAVIFIIPVEPYRKLWADHDAQVVPDHLQKIKTLSDKLPQPAPVRSLPVLPTEEIWGMNDFDTQMRALSGINHHGVRFVGRFAMEARPVVNEDLRYIYQGLSNDGRFLIAAFFPVSTSELADAQEGVSQQENQDFMSNGPGYLSAKAQELDLLPADAWQPDLSKLDALVASLYF